MLLEQVQSSRRESSASLGRLLPAAILILLCLPSFLFVWNNRDVPHFGILQDDGVYLIDAQALAQGAGYRILSLPAQPFETRYPPLYPLYLSLAWHAIPAFPANLSMAIMLSWLSFPAVLMLTYLWCRRHAYPVPITWLVVGLFALNPYVLFFVSNLGSEMLFMMFLLGAVLVADRPDQGGWSHGWRGPLLAGAIAGAGYLIRTSGIALLPAAIAYYVWKKQPRHALWFALGMLPAIAGWMLWSRIHAAPGHDVVTLCYTNYLGYYFMNVGWDNLGNILWRNVSALLEAMGSLVFPQAMEEGLLAKLILWPLALAMILGCVRMVRQGFGRLYAFFGGVSLAMLLVWHYQPNQRFVLPWAPLLLAGFCFEMRYLAERFREAVAYRTRALPLAAYSFAGCLVTVLTVGLVLQISMDIGVVPNLFRDDRANTLAYRSLYRWIASHLPANANVLWQDDTALYLATGRHAASFVVPPREFEATGGEAGEVVRYRRITEYARQQHLDYVLLAKIGLRHNDEVLRDAAVNPDLESVHEEEGGILYRVR
jgi:drug/metabolite transporter superfamily protein YnfA